MKKAILLTFLFISFSVFSQENNTSSKNDTDINQSQLEKIIYFDKDWNEIPKGKHKYYRTFSISEFDYNGQKLFQINDYYKNGNIQMVGYSTRTDSIDRIGLSTFYNPNGSVYRYTLYKYDSFKDVFPEIDKYVSKIKISDIPNKTLFIKFYPKKIKHIGFRNSDGKRIGIWRYYRKNGKYIVVDFKNGVAPTVLRLYNKEDILIKKGYYLPRAHWLKKQNPPKLNSDGFENP